MNHRKLLVGMVALGLQSDLSAQNLIGNSTFESPAFGASFTFLHPGDATLSGWSIVGGEIHVNNDLFVALPANGAGHQYLELTGVTGYHKGVLSDPIPTVLGQPYLLSFDLGAFFSGFNFGDSAVDISFNGVFAGTLKTAHAGSLSADGSEWERVQIPYQANSSSTTIQLLGSPMGSDLGIGVDNIFFGRVPDTCATGGLVLICTFAFASMQITRVKI